MKINLTIERIISTLVCSELRINEKGIQRRQAAAILIGRDGVGTPTNRDAFPLLISGEMLFSLPQGQKLVPNFRFNGVSLSSIYVGFLNRMLLM